MLKDVKYYKGVKDTLEVVLRDISKNTKSYKTIEEMYNKTVSLLEKFEQQRVASNKIKVDNSYILDPSSLVKTVPDTRDRYEDKRKEQGSAYEKEDDAFFFKWVPKIKKNQKFYYKEIKANCKFWKNKQCKNRARCHGCKSVTKYANNWYDMLINPNSKVSGVKAPDDTVVRTNHEIEVLDIKDIPKLNYKEASEWSKIISKKMVNIQDEQEFENLEDLIVTLNKHKNKIKK